MRNNQPVTQHEYEFSSSEMLVSATDLSGNIRYCNPAFIDVSGYSRDELIGQPHNLIRHPDMPRDAFADMWTTIRSGRPWTALVKNRRKNGDFYWVRANVTPVIEHGKAVGFLSVRVKPGRNEVASAEALYARMRAGAMGSLRLEHGVLVRSGIAGRIGAMMRMPVTTRVALGYASTPLALLATGLIAYKGAPPLPLWIAFGVSALVGAFGWASVARQIGTRVGAMSGYATRMAAGDLTVSMEAGKRDDLGEVQHALNQLKANLSAIVLDVRGQIGGMMDAAREISSGNMDLSRRTELQVASL